MDSFVSIEKIANSALSFIKRKKVLLSDIFRKPKDITVVWKAAQEKQGIGKIERIVIKSHVKALCDKVESDIEDEFRKELMENDLNKGLKK